MKDGRVEKKEAEEEEEEEPGGTDPKTRTPHNESMIKNIHFHELLHSMMAH